MSLAGLLSEELHELLAWHTGLKMSREKVKPQDVVGRPFPVDSALPPVVFAFLQRSVQSLLNPLSASTGSVHPSYSGCGEVVTTGCGEVVTTTTVSL